MAYRLTEKEAWFISMHRRDPLQGSDFSVGDKVVICSRCRCVQMADSWEFNDNKCVQCSCVVPASGFQREFVDLSYHREAANHLHGFRIVETDVKFKSDAVRVFFSEGRLRAIFRWTLAVQIMLLIAVVGIGIGYGQTATLDILYDELAPIIQSIPAKLAPFAEKPEALLSAITDKLVDDSGDTVVQKLQQKAESITQRGEVTLSHIRIPDRLAAFPWEVRMQEATDIVESLVSGILEKLR